MSRLTRLVVPLSAAAVVMSVAVMAPGAAAASGYIATPNGMTGITQTITVNAPSQKGNKVSITVVDGAGNSSTLRATVNSKGFGTVTWTPQRSGTATLRGTGSISSIPSSTVSVAGSPSYLELRAPNVAQMGTTSAAVVDVYLPMGNPYGAGNAQLATIAAGPGSSQVIASAPMQAATSSLPTATVPFTMPAPDPNNPTLSIGQVFWAQFQGTTSTPSGLSPAPTILATVDGSVAPVPVAIRSLVDAYSPAAFPLNAPTAIDAVLGPGFPDGTVVWSLDGTPLTGALPTQGGVNAWAWTPTTTGSHTLSVAYSAVAADGVTPVTGSSSISFTVSALQTKDTITVTPKGQSAWKPSSTVKLKNGSSLTLGTKSASGTTVLLSVTGPCVFKGAVLMATGTGTCTVTAVSPGTLKYTPGRATYTVTVTS